MNLDGMIGTFSESVADNKERVTVEYRFHENDTSCVHFRCQKEK